MYRIVMDDSIKQIMFFFHRVGFWHQQNEETVGKRRLKRYFFIYFTLFPISMIAGALDSDDVDEKIVSFEAALFTTVVVIKFWYIIWRKDLLDRICDFYVG